MGQTAPGRSRPTVDPEANLVEALRRQEPGATEALIAGYGDRAYRLAIRITGNHSDAEEAVQDAFWSVVQRIETFRRDAAFGSTHIQVAPTGWRCPRICCEQAGALAPLAISRTGHRAYSANLDSRDETETAGSRLGRVRRGASEYRRRREVLQRFETYHRRPDGRRETQVGNMREP